MRKINLDELKKAVNWIEANSKDLTINVETDGTSVTLKCFDRDDQSVTITLSSNSVLPKITKTEILR